MANRRSWLGSEGRNIEFGAFRRTPIQLAPIKKAGYPEFLGSQPYVFVRRVNLDGLHGHGLRAAVAGFFLEADAVVLIQSAESTAADDA